MSAYIQCPHCEEFIEIEQINCGIFRHGHYKINKEQIPPHLPETECKKLINDNMIYGCGKPFKYDGNKVEICGYI